ncbi:MAG: S-layer homology domain-containing protein [Cellulomonas sp.]|nr:S-layer homology domain-containing protein [Cellulomonas sp.]
MVSAAVAASDPVDVASSSPFYADVQWLVSAGVTKPGTDGRFGPGDPVQRAAMAAFLYRSAGSPAFTAPTSSPFTDVASADAFYAEMAWLASTGVTKPGADGRFGPNDHHLAPGRTTTATILGTQS